MNIPTTYLPRTAAHSFELTQPLFALVQLLREQAESVLRYAAAAEEADDVQALRDRADRLLAVAPSFAADLYAAADRHEASQLH